MSEAFPNPTNGNTNFEIYTPVKGEASIRMYDNAGRLVYDRLEKINIGNTQIELDLENVAKGAYSLEVKFGLTNFVNVQKIIKQ